MSRDQATSEALYNYWYIITCRSVSYPVLKVEMTLLVCVRGSGGDLSVLELFIFELVWLLEHVSRPGQGEQH